MKIYNSLTGSKEQFVPNTPDQVNFYVCGPTVYDTAHLGNARPVIVFDTLYRLLKQKYKNVIYVRNITDVDDKIYQRAQDEGVDINVITQRAVEMYHEDMLALNALSPTHEPRATAYIDDMITMIGTLIDKGHAYVAEEHVLFNTKSYKSYGKLARRSLDEMVAGARVEIAPYKKSAHDFVLWKPSVGNWPGWQSPWGFGRPGWHIECSAMSRRFLGDNFDIHGGGIDLIFPHHENEVAQSCCANGNTKMANYWMHNGHLSVDGQKMSKSLGNFITVRDLLNRGEKGEVIRFALLQTHYRQPFDWTENNLQDARHIIDRFYQALRSAGEILPKVQVCSEFMAALDDDLNTPLAIRRMQHLAQDIFKASHEAERKEYASQLKACGDLIGILQQDVSEWFQGCDADQTVINDLIEKRRLAKINRNFNEADDIRSQLNDMGIDLEDSKSGTTWRRK